QRRKHQRLVGHYNARPGEGRVEVPPEGRIPCPSTGLEVLVPGRQGIRALRDFNPACGSANLLWDLPPRSLPFLPVVSRQGRVNGSAANSRGRKQNDALWR